MKEVGRYRVTGKRAYRGNDPGTEFEATLEPGAEARAINRGSIALLERLAADLPPGKYRLPADGQPTTEGKEGLADG